MRRKPRRTTWVYCPTCRRDLNGDDESYIDSSGDWDQFEQYLCASCGFRSEFDFDAPVPLYLGEWQADSLT